LSVPDDVPVIGEEEWSLAAAPTTNTSPCAQDEKQTIAHEEQTDQRRWIFERQADTPAR